MSCPSINPAKLICSGNGDCLSGFCECYDNWKSTGDYSIVPGLDCDVNISVTRGLAMVSIFTGAVSMLIIGRYIYKKIIIFIRTIDMEYRIPEIASPTLLFIAVVILTTIAILKAVDPSRFIIGKSIFITTIFSIFCFVGWYGEIVYLRMHFKFLIGFQNFGAMTTESKEKMTETIENFRKNVAYFCYFSIIASTIPLIGLAFPDDQYLTIGMIFFWIIDADLIAYYTVIVRCVHGVRIQLQQSISAMDQANHLADDFIHDTYQINRICFFLAILEVFYYFIIAPFLLLLLVFGSWDYLMRKSDYITLFICIAYQVMYALFILSVSYFSPQQLKDADMEYKYNRGMNDIIAANQGEYSTSHEGSSASGSSRILILFGGFQRIKDCFRGRRAVAPCIESI